VCVMHQEGLCTARCSTGTSSHPHQTDARGQGVETATTAWRLGAYDGDGRRGRDGSSKQVVTPAP